MMSDNIFFLMLVLGAFAADFADRGLDMPAIRITLKQKKQSKSKQTKIKVMIEVKTGIFYDSSLSYDEQSEDLKEYVMQLYESIEKIPYPEFNSDGSISYFADDGVLTYEFRRVQQTPFSKMDRAVKELQIVINLKNA